MGCHALLQGIFPTQGSKLGLLYCRRILYHLSYRGLPAVLSNPGVQPLRGFSLRWGVGPLSSAPGVRIRSAVSPGTCSSLSPPALGHLSHRGWLCAGPGLKAARSEGSEARKASCLHHRQHGSLLLPHPTPMLPPTAVRPCRA